MALIPGGMEELAEDWRDFYSQSATDAWFKKTYQRAYEQRDFESIARLLSGRLRQMEKRCRAANKRADEMEAALAALTHPVQS